MAKLRLRVGNFGGTSRVGDIVKFNNQDWVCKKVTSLPPPDPEFWQPVAIRDEAFDVEGPQGPQGLPGRDGKDAPPARDGRDGRDGKGLNWRGEWKRRRQYEPNDVVEWEGSTYVATESTRDEPGTRSRGWQLMAAKGADGRDGQSLQGPKGRPGADGQTIVIENGNPPVAAIFDSTTVRGDVLYVAETGHVDLAQANGEPQATAVGIALASVAAGLAGTYQTTGPVSNPAWNLTPGAVYYLSPTVAGGMTDTFPNTPGDYVVILGAALSATELNLNIHWALVIGS